MTTKGAGGALTCAVAAALLTGLTTGLLTAAPHASAQGGGGGPTDGITGNSDGRNLSVVVVNLSGNGYRPGSGSTGGDGGGGGSVRVEVATPCFWTSAGGAYTGQTFYDAYFQNGKLQNFGVSGLDLPSDAEIEAHKDEEGYWYFVGQDSNNGQFTAEDLAKCDAELQAANGSGYVFVPAGEEPPPVPAAAVPPETLAEIAYDNLAAPDPVVGRSPGGRSIVNLPTWFWVENDPGDDADGFVPLEVTATAGDNSATVTATPELFTVEIPGQAVAECTADKARTEYGRGVDEAAACTVSPRRASVGQPDQAFPVEARASYSVSWFGVVDGVQVPGDVPQFQDVAGETTIPVPVAEIQAVVRTPR